MASVKDVFKEVRQSKRDNRADSVQSRRGDSAGCFVVRHYEQEKEDGVLAFRLEEWRRKGGRVCSHVIM